MYIPPTIVRGEFIPCKKCGKDHGMGVKNMITGDFTPTDTCNDCFIYGTFVPITEQIHLNVEDVE